jgi:hypothetical protein
MPTCRSQDPSDCIDCAMKEPVKKINCDDCSYKAKCIKEWGEEYQAVIGTHHCKRSWGQLPRAQGPWLVT